MEVTYPPLPVARPVSSGHAGPVPVVSAVPVDVAAVPAVVSVIPVVVSAVPVVVYVAGRRGKYAHCVVRSPGRL